MASTSSATPSQSTPKFIYDVFLSFRGEYVRKTFLGHLNYHLKQIGIQTFKDDEQLNIGDCIAPRLLQSIQESRVAIVIFSKNYASSTWCLDEVAKIMECKEKLNQVVVPIFYDVEPSHVRKQTGSFAESFAKHEENFKDDKGKGKVEGWRKVLTEAGSITGHDLQGDKYKGNELDCIKGVVNDIFKQLPPTPSIPKNFVGLESRLEEISTFMEVSSENDKLILGIWGMGGIGKTTIARAAFEQYSSKFEKSCFLADIREKHSSKGGMEALQETLLKVVLKVDSIEIHNAYDGINMIKERLKQFRVLIVLDDVDEQEQLDKLVGDGEWLYNGSRIIITTRDKHLFSQFGVDVIECYEVKKLDEEKALQLFSWHAFKKESPDKGFEDLSRDFVTYAGGLPLALKLWGSSLCRRKEEEWKSTLEKIKGIPDDKLKVVSQLKISVDGLDDGVKKIFLDIACFFRKKSLDYVKDALKSCDLHPGIGIPVLIERCLLFESDDGDIDMHDLIQEMGWHIASQEKPRSRVWQLKDVDEVLSGKMEPKAVEGILLSFRDHSSYDENISPSIEAFKQMTKLKMLIVKYHYDYSSESLKSDWMSIMDYLPKSLMVIIFKYYPWSKPFCPKEMKNLTYLDLKYSTSLLETPNFAKMPNLEKLRLSECEKLKEIHPSIGNLTKLVKLDLSGCSNLEKLPSFNQVSSLECLNLSSCSKLEIFPEIKEMKNLTYLDLTYCIYLLETPNFAMMPNLEKLLLSGCEKLKEIHPSVGNLMKLVELDLTECSNLEKLPSFNQEMKNLTDLHVAYCSSLLETPNFAMMPNLENLCLSDCEKLKVIHPSVGNLMKLVELDLSGCSNLEKLPSFNQVSSLKSLYLRRCRKIENFPEIKACTPYLVELDSIEVGLSTFLIDATTQHFFVSCFLKFF